MTNSRSSRSTAPETAPRSRSFPIGRSSGRAPGAVGALGALLCVGALFLSGCQTPWGRLDEDSPPPVFDEAALEPTRQCVVCPGGDEALDANDPDVIAYVFEGRTFLFSSEECLLEFKRDPHRFLAHH